MFVFYFYKNIREFCGRHGVVIFTFSEFQNSLRTALGLSLGLGLVALLEGGTFSSTGTLASWRGRCPGEACPTASSSVGTLKTSSGKSENAVKLPEGLNCVSFAEIEKPESKIKLDQGSIRSSPRYGSSTPYRLTIRNSSRLFHIVL